MTGVRIDRRRIKSEYILKERRIVFKTERIKKE